MAAFSVFRSIAGPLLDALLPIECVGCGRPGAYCCSACLSGVRFFAGHFCPGCGEAVTAAGKCGRGRCRLSPVREACAGYPYADPLVREVIRAFKYGGYPCAVRAAEALTTRWACQHARVFDGGHPVIVPVPLHPARRRERGFNQAETIAGAVSAAMKAPVAPAAVSRVRYTEPQASAGRTDSDGLAARFRASNLKGAFAVDRPAEVAGRKVILVDDVWTSGATMRECAAALIAAGARSVSAFALAAAPFRLNISGRDDNR